jgi:hypothetical protein
MKCEAEVRDINYWQSYNINSIHIMCRSVCIEAGGADFLKPERFTVTFDTQFCL